MSKTMYLAVVIELTGIIFTGAGVGIELAMHADIGFLAMTVGSLLLAAGGIIWGKFARRE